MALKIFLDSNVVIDFLARLKEFPESESILNLIREGRIEGWISDYVMAEVLNNLKVAKMKELNKDVLTQEEIKEITDVLEDFIKIVNLKMLSALTEDIDVYNYVKSICINAKDSFILHSAIKLKTDFLISRDEKLKNRIQEIVNIEYPKIFLAKYESIFRKSSN